MADRHCHWRGKNTPLSVASSHECATRIVFFFLSFYRSNHWAYVTPTGAYIFFLQIKKKDATGGGAFLGATFQWHTAISNIKIIFFHFYF
jgi:hypothetical protein